MGERQEILGYLELSVCEERSRGGELWVLEKDIEYWRSDGQAEGE